MAKQAQVTEGATICWSADSCIICREDGRTQRSVMLTPGHEYTECMPVSWADGDDCRAVVPMGKDDTCEMIAGVVTNYQNLVDAAETDECPAAILCGAHFDASMMNWPEGMTKEQVDCVIARCKSPSFARREKPVQLPEFYKGSDK